ncbi:MAG: hypothetical protein HGA43_03700 [Nitrospirae bacterium]|nr:hypothetical protein [Nitrospirota bacterium]
MTVTDSDAERKAIREGVYRNMVHSVSDNYYPFTKVDNPHASSGLKRLKPWASLECDPTGIARWSLSPKSRHRAHSGNP